MAYFRVGRAVPSSVVLSERLDAAFFYNPSFAEEFERLIAACACDDEEGPAYDSEVDTDAYIGHTRAIGGSMTSSESNKRNYFKPRKHSLDMLLEYIELLETRV